MNIRLAAVALLACAACAHANTISYFSFNNTPIGTPNSIPYTYVDADDPKTGNVTISQGKFYASVGTTFNAVGSTTAGQCLLMKFNDAPNGSALTFNFLDVSKFTNLVFSYATSKSSSQNGAGFATQSLAYAVNGSGIYSQFGTVSPAGYSIPSFDLGSLTGVSTAKSLSIQITFTGATLVNENNRLDNVRLDGDPVATPAAVPLPPAILGGAALLGVRAFKRRRQ